MLEQQPNRGLLRVAVGFIILMITLMALRDWEPYIKPWLEAHL